MQNNRDILLRLRIVYFGAILLGLAIVARAFTIGVVQRDQWLKLKEKDVLKHHVVEAPRGNIYAEDGSLLATSLPIYTVRLDFEVERLQKIYEDSVGKLLAGLEKIIPDFDSEKVRRELNNGFRLKSTSALVGRDLNYKQLSEMRKLPILRERAKAGMVLEQTERRVMPFKSLAYKTLGNTYEKNRATGLESTYNTYLAGVNGKRLKQKMSGGVWRDVNDENEVEPKEGNDIVTSLDVQLQDAAEAALRRALLANKAQAGCVVVMEVKTGYVKAISNLSRSLTDSARYSETSNLAVEAKWDPGSTFKLASVLALLEDGLADTSDLVDTQGGVIRLSGKEIFDSKMGGYGVISLAKAFTESSNVGIIKAVLRGYRKNQSAFINRLRAFKLDSKSGIDLAEELNPTIYFPGHSKWSDLSLPSLAMGYEILIPPIQVLAFYNAVANNGYWVKPQLVKEIKHNGQTIKRFDPQVSTKPICSEASVKKVHAIMKDVVNNGTAKNIRNPFYQIAGKTGTVKKKLKVNGEEKVQYRASFAGFFPYDNPRYSCIVVIENPGGAAFYGSVVAAPVFKDIADRLYARSDDMHTGSVKQFAAVPSQPNLNKGFSSDMEMIARETGTSVKIPASGWTKIRHSGNTISALPESFNNSEMPDLTGMGLRDALYLLENMGLTVKPSGKGKVRRQSVAPGTPIRFIKHVVLELA
jgi:cell division protein FtsI (penicillin-binding protein 3)